MQCGEMNMCVSKAACVHVVDWALLGVVPQELSRELLLGFTECLEADDMEEVEPLALLSGNKLLALVLL